MIDVDHETGNKESISAMKAHNKEWKRALVELFNKNFRKSFTPANFLSPFLNKSRELNFEWMGTAGIVGAGRHSNKNVTENGEFVAVEEEPGHLAGYSKRLLSLPADKIYGTLSSPWWCCRQQVSPFKLL